MTIIQNNIKRAFGYATILLSSFLLFSCGNQNTKSDSHGHDHAEDEQSHEAHVEEPEHAL